MKTCRICKIKKPLDSFYKQIKNKDGYKNECRNCSLEKHRNYRANGGKEKERAQEAKKRLENPNYRKDYYYQKKYGISLTEYETMLKAQNGKCKLCNQTEFVRATSPTNKPRKLSVDHCHTTGRVRGLLCHNCNVFLGQYEKWKDKFDLLEAYLNAPGFYSRDNRKN